MSCPFCGFHTVDPYAITLHVEENHFDDSPFAVRETSPDPVAITLQQEEDQVAQNGNITSRFVLPSSPGPKRKLPGVDHSSEDASLALALRLQEEEDLIARKKGRISDGQDRTSHSSALASRAASEEEQEQPAADDDFPYFECPECEEYVHLADYNDHIDLHASSLSEPSLETDLPDPIVKMSDTGYETIPEHSLTPTLHTSRKVLQKRSQYRKIPSSSSSGDTIARSINGFLSGSKPKGAVKGKAQKQPQVARLGVGDSVPEP